VKSQKSLSGVLDGLRRLGIVLFTIVMFPLALAAFALIGALAMPAAIGAIVVILIAYVIWESKQGRGS
jgi:hypothetical protein